MKNVDSFHGLILARIIQNQPACLEKYEGNNSSYIINDRIGIYMKYSSKRMSPWTFSFSKTHINEIKDMKNRFEKTSVALICGSNGICCLNYSEFGTVLSIENRSFPKWVKASRLKGEKYSVSGSDGKLRHKVGNSDFPSKIYE